MNILRDLFDGGAYGLQSQIPYDAQGLAQQQFVNQGLQNALAPVPLPPTMRERIEQARTRIRRLRRDLAATRAERNALIALDRALTDEYGPEA